MLVGPEVVSAGVGSSVATGVPPVAAAPVEEGVVTLVVLLAKALLLLAVIVELLPSGAVELFTKVS